MPARRGVEWALGLLTSQVNDQEVADDRLVQIQEHLSNFSWDVSFLPEYDHRPHSKSDHKAQQPGGSVKGKNQGKSWRRGQRRRKDWGHLEGGGL